MTTPLEHRLPLILGIDPGGRETGLAAIAGLGLVAGAVLDRGGKMPTDHGYSSRAWAAANIEAIERILGELDAAIFPGPQPPDTGDDWRVGMGLDHVHAGRIVLAIENVRAPNPHRARDDGNSLTNPDGIIVTSWVAGAVLARWPNTVIVEPAGNGAGPSDAYPVEIRAKVNLARKGPPADRLRHVRSAYDVALAARYAMGRLHGEAQRAADVVEPVLRRVPIQTITAPR